MFIKTPAFVKNLDTWLFKNDKRAATYLDLHRQHIPLHFRKYDKPLYRGMAVDKKFLEELKKKGFVKFETQSSWSKDENMAKKFVNDPKYRLGHGGTRILIKRQFKSAELILDIEAFCQFFDKKELMEAGLDELSYDSAMKEREVLVERKIEVKSESVIFL